jgi:Na+/melibiose symporter-like transporter
MRLCHRYNFETNSGAIAISVVPLLADYVDHKSRGTCAAFLVLMSSLGALSSAEINFSVLNNVSSDSKIYIQYGIISAMIIVIGLIYTLICLKPGNDYYTKGKRVHRSPR